MFPFVIGICFLADSLREEMVSAMLPHRPPKVMMMINALSVDCCWTWSVLGRMPLVLSSSCEAVGCRGVLIMVISGFCPGGKLLL